MAAGYIIESVVPLRFQLTDRHACLHLLTLSFLPSLNSYSILSWHLSPARLVQQIKLEFGAHLEIPFKQ